MPLCDVGIRGKIYPELPSSQHLPYIGSNTGNFAHLFQSKLRLAYEWNLVEAGNVKKLIFIKATTSGLVIK